MRSAEVVSIEEIVAARERISGWALPTPLVRLPTDSKESEIWLKLENLQPGGSFKIRGAANALRSIEPRLLQHGVWTASAGNMAQSLAWFARREGVPCSVLVPDNASAVKLAAIRGLGARIVAVPFAEYQDAQRRRAHESMDGYLVHPFADRAVMAGNGTIGLELVEELEDVDAVVVPYGGGGLSCGIAAAIRAMRPEVKVYACEVEHAAPLAPSLAADKPVEVDYHDSFVSGMGAPFVFPDMWPLASQLLAGSLVVPVSQVADAIRTLVAGNNVIAEGAGAVAVAAALAGHAGSGRVVCIVSGGNIDIDDLVAILQGKTPQVCG